MRVPASETREERAHASGRRQADSARETAAVTGVSACLQEPKSWDWGGPALGNPRPSDRPASSHSDALSGDQDTSVRVLPLESLAEKQFVRQQKHNVLLFFRLWSFTHFSLQNGCTLPLFFLCLAVCALLFPAHPASSKMRCRSCLGK